MEKKLLLWALICIFQIFFTPLFAISGADGHKNQISVTVCDAPPPGDFHVVSRSQDEIALAWTPAWAEALYELKVLIQTDPTGIDAWTPLYIFHDVAGSSFTVNNVAFDVTYKFAIATICNSGEVSVSTAECKAPKIILEATVGGRTPISPREISCQLLGYNQYNWAGFEVSTKGGGISIKNLFEIDFSAYNHGKISLRRVIEDSQIVVTDDDYNFPVSNQPPIIIPFKFKVVNMPLNEIGTASLVFYHDLSLFDLCPTPFWPPSYSFKFFVSDKATKNHTSIFKNFNQNYDYSDLNTSENISVQNPIQDDIKIFIPYSKRSNGVTKFSLYTSNGPVVSG